MSDPCACRFNEDDEQVKWCAVHLNLRDRLVTVTRERDEARQAFASFDALFRGVRQLRDEAMRERDALRAEVERAIPAMREYAAKNPRHNTGFGWQDPNGVHAWLSRNDKQEPTP